MSDERFLRRVRQTRDLAVAVALLAWCGILCLASPVIAGLAFVLLVAGGTAALVDHEMRRAADAARKEWD